MASEILWDTLEKYDVRFAANEIDRLICLQRNDKERSHRTLLIAELADEAIKRLEALHAAIIPDVLGQGRD